MASLLNKAKEAIEGVMDKSKGSNTGDHSSSGQHGQHHSDSTSRIGGHSGTQATEQYGTTHGAGGLGSSDNYGSSTSNTGFDNVQTGTTHGAGGISSSDNYGSRTSNTGYDNVQTGQTAPHSSNLLNKADPRVDSDRDHRSNPLSRTGGLGDTQTYGDDYERSSGIGGLGTSDHGRSGTTGLTGGLGTSGHSHSGGTGLTGSQGGTLIHEAVTTESVPHSHGGHGDHTSHTTHATGGLTSGIGGRDTYDNSRSTHDSSSSGGLMNKLNPLSGSSRDNDNYDNSRSTHDSSSSGGLMNKLNPLSGSSRDNDNYGSSGLGRRDHTSGLTGGTSTGTSGIGGRDTYDNSRSTHDNSSSGGLMNKLNPMSGSGRDNDNYESSGVTKHDRDTNFGNYPEGHTGHGHGGDFKMGTIDDTNRR